MGQVKVSGIPVFVPLSRFEGKEPSEMFYAALAKYGRINDEKLVDWFLKQGGFVVFIDGLNEVTKATRDKLNAFVDTNYKSNYFCLTSQLSYPEFSWIEEVGMPVLSPEAMEAVLTKSVGNKKAAQIVAAFDSEALELYMVPQNLAFAIELFGSDHGTNANNVGDRLIPQNRQELYNAVLSPLIREWIAAGRADYPQLLFRRAFAALCSRDSFLDTNELPLPEEMLNSLLKKKFVLRQGDRFQFRHDLVRSFLASRYFVTTWRSQLIRDGIEIDENWNPMLEFVVWDLEGESDIRDFVLLVLKRNISIAGSLFNRLCSTKPHLCASWATVFQKAFGQATLESRRH
jgi:hypothetical protein